MCVESGKNPDPADVTALRRFASLPFLALAAFLAACTSSPSPSPNVVDTTAISVQPSAITIYPGVPATLLINGGTGSYIVASNNQAIVPITVAGVGHQLTVIANPVNANTTVTLSIRDTGTTPPTTATLTVSPGTIANAVTVTPITRDCTVPGTPVPPATTADPVPILCSGGEALLTATLSQAGQLLPARTARFDIVSGDLRFIVTPAGTAPEQLALTTTALSDQNGLLRVRLRALAGAPAQNALVQITDPDTGAFQRIVIPIQQLPTGPGGATFFALPSSITFTGPFVGQCASNAASDFVIFGGTPPYTIVSSSPFIGVSPPVVTASGGSFRAQVAGAACLSNIPISITDAAGRTISVTVSNQEGTQTAPAPAITIQPSSLSLCPGQSGSVAIVGGTTPFSAASNSPFYTPTIAAASPRTLTVTRSAAPNGPTSAQVTVTDGATFNTLSVTTPAPLPAPGGC